MKPTFAQAEVLPGAWKLPKNDVWNVPDAPENEVRGEFETAGPWSLLKSYKALATDREGRIYGWRSLSHPQEDGYCHRGWVKIKGKSYKAFTSSVLFERPDKSLCNVATLYVCGI
jgi:hypothetical protein